MDNYPQRKRGGEYYNKSKKPFLSTPGGGERYARDRRGNQMYPRSNNPFARDKSYQEYYAQDYQGHEIYPCRNKKSIVLSEGERYKIAKFADGSQRYPTDDKGNEYYLQYEGKPFLLQRNDGSNYFAKSHKGTTLIPWNYLHEQLNGDACFFYTKDAAGNGVYVAENELPQSLKLVCRCICQMIFLCPRGFAAVNSCCFW